MNVFSETVAATHNKYKYWNTCMINIILLTDVNLPWMRPVDLDHINATCPVQVSLENCQSYGCFLTNCWNIYAWICFSVLLTWAFLKQFINTAIYAHDTEVHLQFRLLVCCQHELVILFWEKLFQVKNLIFSKSWHSGKQGRMFFSLWWDLFYLNTLWSYSASVYFNKFNGGSAYLKISY